MEDRYIVKGRSFDNPAYEMAIFDRELDARRFVGGLASSGDWRGFKNISVWHHGTVFYTAERGRTHFT